MAGTEKYNTYMRNYMRVRTGAVPRKERFAEHFANFRRIILAGGYGIRSNGGHSGQVSRLRTIGASADDNRRRSPAAGGADRTLLR
jgi:hypothetical protein